MLLVRDVLTLFALFVYLPMVIVYLRSNNPQPWVGKTLMAIGIMLSGFTIGYFP